MKDKYGRTTRALQIGLVMAEQEGWEHVKDSVWKYDELLYDLEHADVKKLNTVINNPKYLITRGK